VNDSDRAAALLQRALPGTRVVDRLATVCEVTVRFDVVGRNANDVDLDQLTARVQDALQSLDVSMGAVQLWCDDPYVQRVVQ
jgi:hypothetical protein